MGNSAELVSAKMYSHAVDTRGLSGQVWGPQGPCAGLRQALEDGGWPLGALLHRELPAFLPPGLALCTRPCFLTFVNKKVPAKL